MVLTREGKKVKEKEVKPLFFTNSHVLKSILDYVEVDEINRCALVSKAFCKAREDHLCERIARTHPNDSKTLILHFNGVSPYQIPPSVWKRWNRQILKRNRNRLVVFISSSATPKSEYQSHRKTTIAFPTGGRIPSGRLTNIRELVFKREPSIQAVGGDAKEDPDERGGGEHLIEFFTKLIMNNASTKQPLDVLDVSALAGALPDKGHIINLPRNDVLNPAPCVFRCVSTPSRRGLYFTSLAYSYLQSSRFNCSNLRELHLDPFKFYLCSSDPPIQAYCKSLDEIQDEAWFPDKYAQHGRDWIILSDSYPNLEKVTIKNCTYVKRTARLIGWTMDTVKTNVTMPQEALMKFVRNSRALCWFKSDLTPENIQTLQFERPDVEFLP